MRRGGSVPYVGPRSFEAGEEGFFFGRDDECCELSELWATNRLIVLHGPAGSGKTSLLLAGIFPLLTDAYVFPLGRVSIGWPFPQAALPDHNPHSLALLSSISPAELQSNLALLSLAEFFRNRALAVGSRAAQPKILVVVDQVEEIFANAGGEKYRDGFFAELGEAMREVPGLRVLLSVRNEVLADLTRYLTHLKEHGPAYFPLSPLDREAAVKAVQLPAEKAGLHFAPGVAEQIVNELHPAPSSDAVRQIFGAATDTIQPSQLQVVCSSLYRELAPGKTIIDFSFSDLGDYITKVLAEFCANVISDIAAEREMAALSLQHWIERTFVTIRGTREPVLEKADFIADLPRAIARVLENRHLLIAEQRSDSRWYILASDALIAALQALNKTSAGAIAPSADAITRLRVASSVLAERDFSLAETHARQALKYSEGGNLYVQADALSLLGNISFEQGRLDAAKEYYGRAAEIREQLQDEATVGRLLGAIGHINAMQEHYLAALEDLQSAVVRLPGDIALLTELAKALLHVSQTQAAAAVFATILAVEPQSIQALAGRGQIYAERGSAAVALDDLGQLMRLRPSLAERPDIRSAHALALARIGQLESATKEAAEALSIAPNNGLVYFRAIRVAASSGSFEHARTLLRQAGEANDPPLSPDQLTAAQRLLKLVEAKT